MDCDHWLLIAATVVLPDYNAYLLAVTLDDYTAHVSILGPGKVLLPKRLDLPSQPAVCVIIVHGIFHSLLHVPSSRLLRRARTYHICVDCIEGFRPAAQSLW